MLIVGLSASKAGTWRVFQKVTMAQRGYRSPFNFGLEVIPLLLLFSLDHSGQMRSITAWGLVGLVVVGAVLFHVRTLLVLARGLNVCTSVKDAEQPKDTGFYVCGGNLVLMKELWDKFIADEERVKNTYPLWKA